MSNINDKFPCLLIVFFLMSFPSLEAASNSDDLGWFPSKDSASMLFPTFSEIFFQ